MEIQRRTEACAQNANSLYLRGSRGARAPATVTCISSACSFWHREVPPPVRQPPSAQRRRLCSDRSCRLGMALARKPEGDGLEVPCDLRHTLVCAMVCLRGLADKRINTCSFLSCLLHHLSPAGFTLNPKPKPEIRASTKYAEADASRPKDDASRPKCRHCPFEYHQASAMSRTEPANQGRNHEDGEKGRGTQPRRATLEAQGGRNSIALPDV